MAGMAKLLNRKLERLLKNRKKPTLDIEKYLYALDTELRSLPYQERMHRLRTMHGSKSNLYKAIPANGRVRLPSKKERMKAKWDGCAQNYWWRMLRAEKIYKACKKITAQQDLDACDIKT